MTLRQTTATGCVALYRTFRRPYWRLPIGVALAYVWLLVVAFIWGFFSIFVGSWWALVPGVLATLLIPLVVGALVNQRGVAHD